MKIDRYDTQLGIKVPQYRPQAVRKSIFGWMGMYLHRQHERPYDIGLTTATVINVGLDVGIIFSRFDPIYVWLLIAYAIVSVLVYVYGVAAHKYNQFKKRVTLFTYLTGLTHFNIIALVLDVIMVIGWRIHG